MKLRPNCLYRVTGPQGHALVRFVGTDDARATFIFTDINYSGNCSVLTHEQVFEDNQHKLVYDLLANLKERAKPRPPAVCKR
jgi:hypothetical protein